MALAGLPSGCELSGSGKEGDATKSSRLGSVAASPFRAARAPNSDTRNAVADAAKSALPRRKREAKKDSPVKNSTAAATTNASRETNHRPTVATLPRRRVRRL